MGGLHSRLLIVATSSYLRRLMNRVKDRRGHKMSFLSKVPM